MTDHDAAPAAGAGHSDPQRAAVPEARRSPAHVQEVVSPGGVRAWLVEEHAVPLLALEFAFVGGSSQDPARRPGVANMLSGLLDEGAGPYDSDAFQEQLADYAVELRFSADRDAFRGSLKTLAANLPKAAELLRLALAEARLDADAIERVRGQIIAGLRHDASNPEVMAMRAFNAMAFGDHPYGRPARGDPDSVAAITRDDLSAYRAGVLARSNLHVAAVGAIDAAGLAALLDVVFGDLPQAADLVGTPQVTVGAPGAVRVIDLDTPQTVVRFGAPGLARLDPDYMAAYVANHILGGGVFSSRLFREVREKRGLAYGVSSGLYPMRHSAMFFGGVATQNARVAESVAVIAGEIARMGAEGPTEEEVRLAKQFLIGSYALHFDTSSKIAGQLLQLSLDGLDSGYIDRRNALVAAVTLEDVRRAAARFLDPARLLVVAVGRPEGLAERPATA
ncbi:M16 family metallopeptidase [Camelimonas abortus]|uniref:M16 family metallopeptidase n=1 Tax=Camelimonas abortus TaxID=1017184 RepID=A0ABV7LF25_9HYPH